MRERRGTGYEQTLASPLHREIILDGLLLDRETPPSGLFLNHETPQGGLLHGRETFNPGLMLDHEALCGVLCAKLLLDRETLHDRHHDREKLYKLKTENIKRINERTLESDHPLLVIN